MQEERSEIITADPQDKLDYSETTQSQIVAELLRDYQFAADALPRLKPQYFTKEQFGDIVAVLKDFMNRYKSLPTTSDLFLDHFLDLSVANKRLTLDDGVKKLVTSLLAKNADGSWVYAYDPAPILGKISGFIREAAMKDALWGAVPILATNKPNKFQDIKKMIDDAVAVDIGSNRISLAQFLQDKKQNDMNRTSSMLGYSLRKFQTLARNTDGVQPGFYIIAAETNVGKTAVLTNISHDLLVSNPHVKVIFITLDDSKNIIVNRFLAVLSGLPINQLQKKQTTPIFEGVLNEAYEELGKLVSENRMDILDISEVNTVSSIEAIIRKHEGEDLVVVIDGLYNLGIGENAKGNAREDNVERATMVKSLVSTYNIPILATGELRKKQKSNTSSDIPTVDDLMESGKYAYNADLVLLLYPEDRADYKSSDSPIIRAEYAKNKLSHFRGDQRLQFHKMQNRIEEFADPARKALENLGKTR